MGVDVDAYAVAGKEFKDIDDVADYLVKHSIISSSDRNDFIDDPEGFDMPFCIVRDTHYESRCNWYIGFQLGYGDDEVSIATDFQKFSHLTGEKATLHVFTQWW